MYVLIMKDSNRLRDRLLVGVFFAAFYISLKVLDGLLFDVFGILFFVAMSYGVVSIWKKTKFVF